jgi:hypothetical protein
LTVGGVVWSPSWALLTHTLRTPCMCSSSLPHVHVHSPHDAATDFSDEITTMAPDMLAAAAGEGGAGFGDDDGWEDGGGGGGGGGHGVGAAGNGGLPGDLHAWAPGEDGENPVMMFLRALLPWNVVVPRGGDPPPPQ